MKKLFVKIARGFGKIIGKQNGTRLIRFIYKTTDAPILLIAYQEYGIMKCCSMDITGEQFVIEKILPPFIQQTDYLIDVGANQGDYALVLKKSFPKNPILCVEPNEHVYKILEKNTGLPCINVGLGTETGPRSFYISSSNLTTTQGSLSPQSISNSDELKKIMVEIQRLDQVVAAQGIENIGLLKVDAEGYDLDVLKSGGKEITKIKFIQFEFNEKAIYNRWFLKDFYDLLSNSHHIYRLDTNHLWDINDYHLYLEVFRFQNILAVRKDIALQINLKWIKKK